MIPRRRIAALEDKQKLSIDKQLYIDALRKKKPAKLGITPTWIA
jgi:hypothetical protein